MNLKMKVSALHYGDLASAAMNGGDETYRIWEKLKPKLEIVENPTPDDFLMDLSVMFYYPHMIKVQDVETHWMGDDCKKLVYECLEKLTHKRKD